MREMMYVYLMNLGDNMWGDLGSKITYARYYDTLSVDEAVWKKTIDFLPSQGFNTVLVDVGDAVQYDSHPEISVKGAWSKEKLKQELDRMRAMGLTPIPKLNFSAGHDAWLGVYSRMLSTPQYYQVCKDLIEEVVELFDHPKYFHLGMDEENAEMQGGLAFLCVRQYDLWWHDLYYLLDICEKCGVRPWTWADYAWRYPEVFVEKMPKSVLLSNAWYNRIRKKPDGTYKEVQLNTYRLLENAGYDQIPCSSTFEGVAVCAFETMRLGKETIAEERLYGYMTAPWYNPRCGMEYQLMNDARQFRLGLEKVYPEALRR